jgi:isoleucyl-tRNA synthetase
MVSSVQFVEKDTLEVVATVAEGHKCERCWNIVELLNEHHVCARCEAVLKEDDYEHFNR